MTTLPDSKTLEELLAEADELIRKFNEELLQNLEGDDRRQVEQHRGRLEEIKSALQQKAVKKEGPEGGSFAKGIHEALLDIVKAMKDLSRYFS